MFDDVTQVALATRCLWSLQEAAPEVEGLIVADISGIPITSTLSGAERTQRLSALSAALFLLGEHAAELWGQGATETIQLVIRDDEDQNTRYVIFKPIGEQGVLVVVHRAMPSRFSEIEIDVMLVTQYLDALLSGEEDLPPLRW